MHRTLRNRRQPGATIPFKDFADTAQVLMEILAQANALLAIEPALPAGSEAHLRVLLEQARTQVELAHNVLDCALELAGRQLQTG
ncbi:hypothetical protein GCM10007860_33840 [Chitiniphilus shinanonensis]|uniref:Uncharacterized protein n=1 Tax=Chitiniphilus shinanonensis TaxID=553088 RepID=A0ABQ6BXI2_9NEIS|nr:hypothetical protein [Chitiniphilus shinanonensis]GLS06214.1 hypothetical protein GCM10007860_33840 [Chitiniphilus shinanonensis]